MLCHRRNTLRVPPSPPPAFLPCSKRGLAKYCPRQQLSKRWGWGCVGSVREGRGEEAPCCRPTAPAQGASVCHWCWGHVPIAPAAPGQSWGPCPHGPAGSDSSGRGIYYQC